MSKKLYMAVTADEYELPLFVGGSLKEVAEHYGKSVFTISSSISLGNTGAKTGRRYVKVEVEDEGEDCSSEI